MPDASYTRDYFHQYASEWLADAYGTGPTAPRFPTGAHRVSVTLEGIAREVGTDSSKLVDLGCGGGDLCLHAARLGMDTLGIDIAEGMIGAADEKVGAADEAVAKRLEFRVGDALATGLEDGAYDAAVALGLIEYLPDDAGLFAEAARVLRSGGVFAVSCRNRLFNLASNNDYTKHEVAEGAAPELIDEFGALAAGGLDLDALGAFLDRFEALLPDLRAALAADRAEGPLRATHPSFGEPRRQHTPGEITAAAAAAGFEPAGVAAVHPHALPSGTEHSAPRTYNQLGRAMQAFEWTPAALLWSSAYVAFFRKP